MPSRILRLWNPNASAWEEVGDSRLTAHIAAADPHPAYLQETLADAKGDLFAASAADTVGRLALGTNGQVLTADSTATLGVRWAAAAAGGDFVEAAGDTMSGTLAFQGASVDSGGAIRVVPSGGTGTDTHAYGAGSPAFAPIGGGGTTDEQGLAFSVAADAPLVAVRWYCRAAGQAVPGNARLWDSTSTGAAVWSVTNPPEWTNTTVGWKEHRLAAGTQPTLVAGRTYAIAYGSGSPGASTSQASYVPVPDAGMTFLNHVQNGNAGVYPANVVTTAFGIDPVVLGGGGGPVAPAASGAIRLPNGDAGALAWRNGAGTADLTLTANSSNALTFNGSALLTQTTGDARYLQLTGGTLSGNLGVGVAPAAGWHSSRRVVQVGLSGSLIGTTVGSVEIADNTVYDAGGAQQALRAAAGARLYLDAGALGVQTAPSVAAGAAQTFTPRLQVAQTGTVTLTPDAGQFALTGSNGAEMTIAASTGHLALRAANAIVAPWADNSTNLGHSSLRWATVYAVNGTIQTSLAEAKEAITPLSPEDALAAVRATDPVLFDYTPPERGPEWYELPDDPEQAAQVLEQRLTAAPLEAGARHQAGVVLGHDTYRTDPLFQTGEGQTNPSNSFGVLLAALKAVDARLSALEGA